MVGIKEIDHDRLDNLAMVLIELVTIHIVFVGILYQIASHKLCLRLLESKGCLHKDIFGLSHRHVFLRPFQVLYFFSRLEVAFEGFVRDMSGNTFESDKLSCIHNLTFAYFSLLLSSLRVSLASSPRYSMSILHQNMMILILMLSFLGQINRGWQLYLLRIERLSFEHQYLLPHLAYCPPQPLICLFKLPIGIIESCILTITFSHLDLERQLPLSTIMFVIKYNFLQSSLVFVIFDLSLLGHILSLSSPLFQNVPKRLYLPISHFEFSRQHMDLVIFLQIHFLKRLQSMLQFLPKINFRVILAEDHLAFEGQSLFISSEIGDGDFNCLLAGLSDNTDRLSCLQQFLMLEFQLLHLFLHDLLKDVLFHQIRTATQSYQLVHFFTFCLVFYLRQ